jgi:hypothetical protein
VNISFVSILLLILVLYLKVIKIISEQPYNNVDNILFGNFSIYVSRKI